MTHSTVLVPDAHGPPLESHSPPHSAAHTQSTKLPQGSLAPQLSLDTLKRDAQAGIVTGLMAIPLSVGICVMSHYPVQTGLATVVAACIVSFVCYLFRPGNHIGVPGVAAGLAPVLALGIEKFGFENMPWLIFLTSLIQMGVWYWKLESYILKVVPTFLVEGLLAGVGLKIALKFLPETYRTRSDSHELPSFWSQAFWSNERLFIMGLSFGAFMLFLYLYRRFKDTSPGVPYIAVIFGAIALSFFVELPMLEVERVPFVIAAPFPDFSKIEPLMLLEMLLFALMLAMIDVIEQVMSNAAIERIDPYGRAANSNNSVLVMWLGNLVSSFFGGMTNLDGLAKSSTNRMAGAVTKTSVLFVAAVLLVVILNPALLDRMPEFALAVLMIFTGGKMILGLYHVAQYGKYELGLAMLCGMLVYEAGIFEALIYALSIHSLLTWVIYRHERIPMVEIAKRFLQLFADRTHPHNTETMNVHEDPITGALIYSSVRPDLKKDIDGFIRDWGFGINHRNLLATLSTYHPSGMLWGTFAKELRTGHINIRGYFEHLFELDELHVHFDSGETRQYGDIFIRSGAYTFSFKKRGKPVHVPARYSFVCKREERGWFILEHHSSEFPA